MVYQVDLPSYLSNNYTCARTGYLTTIVPGSSNSSLGGLIIRGPEGDWINMRSNFYDPSMEIYDGRWHYHVVHFLHTGKTRPCLAHIQSRSPTGIPVLYIIVKP